MKWPILWRIVGFCILAAIACLSLMPLAWKARVATVGPLHDCVHVIAFFAACLLTVWNVKRAGVAAWIGLLILSFGILLEFLESGRFGNPVEFHDMVSDALGVAASLLVYNLRRERQPAYPRAREKNPGTLPYRLRSTPSRRAP